MAVFTQDALAVTVLHVCKVGHYRRHRRLIGVCVVTMNRVLGGVKQTHTCGRHCGGIQTRDPAYARARLKPLFKGAFANLWKATVSVVMFSVGKIYINVPKTQYNIFNKTMCMQCTRYCIHSNCLFTTILIFWPSGAGLRSWSRKEF
jgi:hypothetical protein